VAKRREEEEGVGRWERERRESSKEGRRRGERAAQF